MQSEFPTLSDGELDQILAAYPLDGTTLPEHAEYFPQASAIFGDSYFTCPGNFISQSVAQYFSPSSIWNYRYNVIDQALVAEGLGVTHTFETAAIFGVEYAGVGGDTGSSYATYNAPIVPQVMAYYISFVTSLDPNAYRFGGSPTWDNWGAGQGGKRLKIQTDETAMEEVPQDQIAKCALWYSLQYTLKQ